MQNIVKLQEIFFDLCDLLESNDLSKIKIKGFQEFNTLNDFIIEQKDKLSQIEGV